MELQTFHAVVALLYAGSVLMAVQLTKRLFTVDDYHRMVDAGILHEKDRVELIEGEVLAMSPIGPPHCAAVDRATRAMVNGAGEKAIVRVQAPVQLDRYNQPEPDIVLLKPKEDFYATRHPGPADILLIVEVAQSSIDYDRSVKARIYSRTGIVEYWLADVEQDCVFVFSDPGKNGYRTVRQFSRGQSLTPYLLPNCQVTVDSLLP
jgi:Uma2 family endonuclease